MYPKVFVCLALLVCLSQAFEENYCDPTLCEDGLTHTACDHYLEFAQECGEEPEIVSMTAGFKRLILDLHNQHRNRVSAGKLPGYAPAARMPVMRWNDDLAHFAGLHARTCSSDNDRCRNTRVFRNVGQNIGYDMLGERVKNVTAVIKRIVEAWNNEYKLGNQNNMKWLTSETVEEMGRFAMMINDRTSDIGCALVKFSKDDLYHVYFTCNYGSNTQLEQRVYETGSSCSKCVTGCNKIWSALCSPDERIDPNHYHVDTLRSCN